jgi:hypothetical protein
LKLKNPSNTNIVPWGGKLLSYFEAGVPHRYKLFMREHCMYIYIFITHVYVLLNSKRIYLINTSIIYIYIWGCILLSCFEAGVPHRYVYKYIFSSMHLYVYKYIHLCVSRIYAYIYDYMHIYVYVNINIYVYIYKTTYICINMYFYICIIHG